LLRHVRSTSPCHSVLATLRTGMLHGKVVRVVKTDRTCTEEMQYTIPPGISHI